MPRLGPRMEDNSAAYNRRLVRATTSSTRILHNTALQASLLLEVRGARALPRQIQRLMAPLACHTSGPLPSVSRAVLFTFRPALTALAETGFTDRAGLPS